VLAGPKLQAAGKPPPWFEQLDSQEPAVSHPECLSHVARLSDRALFEIRATTGDSEARDELVSRFMPLAVKLARRYAGGREPLDDLVQVASLGLVKAVDRYEAARGTAFSSFAVPTIVGELKRHFRDAGWAVHVPRELQELSLRARAKVDDLSRSLGRSPTSAEVAAALDEPVVAVIEALECGTAQRPVSLDAPARSGSEEDGTLWHDRLGVEEDGYERAEWHGALDRGLTALDARDRVIIALRFAEGLSQSEIAARTGVSQMHVSRLLRRALDRLRAVAEVAA
jgi:RNA polymerase sigma-B factor